MEFQTKSGVGIHQAPGQLTWRASSPFGYAGESRCSGQPATVIRGPGQQEANATVGSVWRILEDSHRSGWLTNRMAAVLPTRTSQNLVVLVIAFSLISKMDLDSILACFKERKGSSAVMSTYCVPDTIPGTPTHIRTPHPYARDGY